MHTITTKETVAEIKSIVADDLKAVDELICEELISRVPLIQAITRHIIQSGGKRLRPLLVILSANAFGYQGVEHHELAAIIEFVHTATLLHDDVVDGSNLRRGQDTANALWGNQASVLSGDFLYSRAFQILTRRSNVAIMKILANTTNSIAEGEVLQLMNQHDPDITEQNYLDVIQHKTAELFQASTQIGAMVSGDDKNMHQAMADYGLHLGMAFQIIDDLLDYTANDDELGKNIGDDLAEGKATMPLIYAMQHAQPKIKALIKTAIEKGGLDKLDVIIEAIELTGARDYTLAQAQRYAELAKNSLANIPTSPYQDALYKLVEFSIARSH